MTRPFNKVIRLGLTILVLLSSASYAAEFGSAALAPTILYDAPSPQAKKTFLLSQGYPLQVLVKIEVWVKVRDSTGSVGWVNQGSFSNRRMVQVKTSQAEVRQTASESAPVIFRVERAVMLELLENPSANATWLRIRHPDGSGGFIAAQQVWGW